jgi:hypothetical protein
MAGRDFVFSDREMHQLVHIPHYNHVSIQEDDALSEKGLGHAGMQYVVGMCSTYVVTCQPEGPGLIVQNLKTLRIQESHLIFDQRSANLAS